MIWGYEPLFGNYNDFNKFTKISVNSKYSKTNLAYNLKTWKVQDLRLWDKKFWNYRDLCKFIEISVILN
jgi:hypothetical protein